jgi:hypothetical protein
MEQFIYILLQIILPEHHTHIPSWKAESGCPNCENMQVVAECALSDKRTGKETIS